MGKRKAAMVTYRLLQLVFLAMIVGELIDGWPLPWGWAFLPGGLSFALALALGRSGPKPTDPAREPVEVAALVRGRWSAVNSPADKVPSHGTHAYGQTYAIDIVAEGETEAEGEAEVAGAEGQGARPGFAAVWPIARRPRSFPAFGAPLHAVADATVVHASDWRRDHLSRNSWPGYAYLMLVESVLREAFGAGWIVGNHVVLDLGDGVHAMYAHLRRGSLTVRPGDWVRAGQVLARCGNSGNSTEPHVHFQLMDGPDLDSAAGIPFRWSGIGGIGGVGVPGNGEMFTASPAFPDPAATDGAGSGNAGGAERDAGGAERDPDEAERDRTGPSSVGGRA
ncbi:murein hydrolase activator EnvC family protein [Streptomyces sp. NPDC016845]|uniref:murein hydrolase activator EnvC family protein n=1 Tax=Streptomyces sp. NPDC016845 TaxID=3364972 RepID=UPI0037B4A205